MAGGRQAGEMLQRLLRPAAKLCLLLPEEAYGADQGKGSRVVISKPASWPGTTTLCRRAATQLFPGKQCCEKVQ